MQLITDRTKNDVLFGTKKGRYSAADLNRVENAVAELVDIARKIGANKTIMVKTDWDIPGPFSNGKWPTKGQMERYLNNVMYLCSLVELQSNLPKSMEKLTYNGANAIEQSLEIVYEQIQKILKTLRYSGEFFAGEESYL